MAPAVDRVLSDPAPPTRTDVVIVGGGIIGACTAFFLAGQGVRVALCEKGEIAAEQSSRNWGWCRQMGRDPGELPLAQEALRLWPQMNALIGAETGFRRAGILYLCRTDKELAKREAWLNEAGRPLGVDSRLLTRVQAARLLPGLAGEWAGGLYTPSDGRAEPGMAAPAIAQAARRLGAAVLTGCAVRGVETSGGRISGVVTEKGAIACDSVVLAGGVWSRLFCKPLGLRMPQLPILSSVMRTDPLAGGPEISTSGFGFGLRKRLDGGYTVASWSGNVAPILPDGIRYLPDFLPALWAQRGGIRPRLGMGFFRELLQRSRWRLDRPSPFERMRVLDPPPHRAILRQARRHLTNAFPVFQSMRVAESWGGMIDVTPDGIPVISAVDTLPGFHIATGFTGHGFGISPAAGQLMAALVTGKAPVVDPAPFRYSRFTDGSHPRPSHLV
ncbi:NAD(P)/FAD-dependent oxidoreductase [Rhodopila sp.]|jgi:glycine/D-amino acid oxidase-like deaminating enzyme|uniref:NAD(P)/FAD-dependent oxidoreductase n=1 Tax=Rhodopila sp. TaxID=2480087 RepID=UPI002C384A0F|nr:FAD-binding oxidoreductase [Rhodopila sp.]HVZ09933.1 FAD-binding oxidoreductase [Rhodopila sp.]